MVENKELIFIPIGKAKDITGKAFGYWTVLGRAPNTIGRTGSNWWCQCVCGNVKAIRKDQLESGASKSCGCYQKEKLRQNGIEFGKKYGPINGKKNKKDLTNEAVFKPVNVLSGGEKVRCMFSRMMMFGSNMLIIDQPTDHLDLESITAVNNGMSSFKGNILFASHDYEIVNTVANRIIEITPNGFIDRRGTYEEFLEYKRSLNN